MGSIIGWFFAGVAVALVAKLIVPGRLGTPPWSTVPAPSPAVSGWPVP